VRYAPRCVQMALLARLLKVIPTEDKYAYLTREWYRPSGERGYGVQ